MTVYYVDQKYCGRTCYLFAMHLCLFCEFVLRKCECVCHSHMYRYTVRAYCRCLMVLLHYGSSVGTVIGYIPDEQDLIFGKVRDISLLFYLQTGYGNHQAYYLVGSTLN